MENEPNFSSEATVLGWCNKGRHLPGLQNKIGGIRNNGKHRKKHTHTKPSTPYNRSIQLELVEKKGDSGVCSDLMQIL